MKIIKKEKERFFFTGARSSPVWATKFCCMALSKTRHITVDAKTEKCWSFWYFIFNVQCVETTFRSVWQKFGVRILFSLSSFLYTVKRVDETHPNWSIYWQESLAAWWRILRRCWWSGRWLDEASAICTKDDSVESISESQCRMFPTRRAYSRNDIATEIFAVFISCGTLQFLYVRIMAFSFITWIVENVFYEIS